MLYNRSCRWEKLIRRGKINAAGWSSKVARRAHNPEVGGSNPSPATNFSTFFIYGGVAQLARAFGSYPKSQRFESVRRYQRLGA